MRFKDEVIIITGAAQGIGRVHAHRFADEGAIVVIADYNKDKGEKVASEIVGKGHKALFIKTDITDEKSTQEMAQNTIDKYGHIDVLINNAAMFSTLGLKPFDQIPIEEWDQTMAVNLKGLWLCCKAVIPFMKSQKKGKIINISSAVWDTGRPFYLHYTTSKAGVIGFTRGLATEVGPWNINVNAVAYTGIITEIERKSFTPEHQKALVQMQPIKRPGTPEEVVGTVMFLASKDSDYMTGQTLHPNGGSYYH